MLCHETGHVMGLKDAYDRTNEKDEKTHPYEIGVTITDE